MKLLHRTHEIAFLVLTMGFLSLGWSCATSRPDVAEKFERYARTSASHDLAALETMTADDIVWKRGRYRLEGKGSRRRIADQYRYRL